MLCTHMEMAQWVCVSSAHSRTYFHLWRSKVGNILQLSDTRVHANADLKLRKKFLQFTATARQ
jgi:hypothetical protein